MKRVVFVINVLDKGGAEKTILTLARSLIDHAFDIHIIVIHPPIRGSASEKITLHILSSGFIQHLPYGIRKQILIQRLKKLLRTLNPIAVFSSLPYAHKITHAGKLDNKNTFYIFHNTLSLSMSPKGSKKNKLKRKYQRLYNHKHIIVLSKGIKEDIIKNLEIKPRKIDVIPNPFDINIIQQLSQKPIHGIPNQRYIIQVGHFYPRKRHDLTIEAFSRLKTDHKLIFLGERGNRKEAEERARQVGIEDRVLFVGWTDNPYPWIRKADLLVLSSDEEGLPRAIVESLICGTPVVSTNCPSGPSEVLIENLSDFLVPVNNASLLAKKMIQALVSYPKIEKKYYLHFDTHNIVKQYLRILDHPHGL